MTENLSQLNAQPFNQLASQLINQTLTTQVINRYFIFDNYYFMITIKQMKIQILQINRMKQKICQMMKS